jgi:hypothetical protein
MKDLQQGEALASFRVQRILLIDNLEEFNVENAHWLTVARTEEFFEY